MAFSTGTLTGSYQRFDGEPAAGTVDIIPNSSVLIDAEGDVILAGKLSVALDADGTFSVVLPATDDETVQPALDRQYKVVARLHHANLEPVAGIALPTGSTVDMADVTEEAEVDAAVSAFITEEQRDQILTGLTELEGSISDAQASFAAALAEAEAAQAAAEAAQLAAAISRAGADSAKTGAQTAQTAAGTSRLAAEAAQASAEDARDAAIAALASLEARVTALENA
jgi:hypothetical protein